jgi:hypothetical protein
LNLPLLKLSLNKNLNIEKEKYFSSCQEFQFTYGSKLLPIGLHLKRCAKVQYIFQLLPEKHTGNDDENERELIM